MVIALQPTFHYVTSFLIVTKFNKCGIIRYIVYYIGYLTMLVSKFCKRCKKSGTGDDFFKEKGTDHNIYYAICRECREQMKAEKPEKFIEIIPDGYKKCKSDVECTNPSGPILPKNNKYFNVSNNNFFARCKCCIAVKNGKKITLKLTNPPDDGFKYCSNYENCINPSGCLLPETLEFFNKSKESNYNSLCRVCISSSKKIKRTVEILPDGYKRCLSGDRCINPNGSLLPVDEFRRRDNQTRLCARCKYCERKMNREQGLRLKLSKIPDGMKFCSKGDKCVHPNGALLPIEEFGENKSKPDGISSMCKYCVRNSKEKSRESERRKKQKQRRNLKIKVMIAYGGKCYFCGEERIEFLTIDHINNDGAEHRKETGGSSGKLYKWLKRNNYPEGFQCLCMNCNCGKYRKNSNKYSVELKVDVFNAYGGCACNCCGETRLECLSLDHVNGGGAQDRKKFGSGRMFYRHLKEENFPNQELYQVLCMNCNGAKGWFGECPHETERRCAS